MHLQDLDEHVIAEGSDLRLGLADVVGHVSHQRNDLLAGEVCPFGGNFLHVGDVFEGVVGHGTELDGAALQTQVAAAQLVTCLLYTSPSPRD